MPNPKEHDRSPQSYDNNRMLVVMCDQLVIDIPSLPSDVQQTVAVLCGAEKPCTDPVGIVSAHLKENPKRIRQLAIAVIDHLPFRDCYAFIGLVRPPAVGNVLISKVTGVLGDARFLLYLVGVNERAKIRDGLLPPWVVDASLKADAMPPLTPDQWEPLAAEIRSMSVLMDVALKDELTQRLKAAEALCGKLSTELSEEKASRKAQEEKLTREHQRGKDNAKQAAEKAADDKYGKRLSDKDAEIKQLGDTLAKLQTELAEAHRVIPQTGVSQADLESLRAGLEKEYADRLETELFLKVRPWLDRLQAAEDGYLKSVAAGELSSQALEMARKEAMEKDLLLLWESEPESALPKIENALAEVDRLLALTAAPSPSLLQMHRQLREAIDGCRATIKSRKDTPQGSLMSNAILAGIKDANYDQLNLIAHSVNNLAGMNVLTDAEATTVAHMINAEKALRQARQEHKTSTFSLLNGDLRSGKEVDILVDAYNFMHLAKQHFAKLERPVQGNPTKSTFDKEGRAKLALMASRITAKFKQARVLLFLDGQGCEKARPYDGVQFKLPTIQKVGEGQADAEIIHHLSHGARHKAAVYVVSNDHQVRDTANRHLSVGLFAKLLDELG